MNTQSKIYVLGYNAGVVDTISELEGLSTYEVMRKVKELIKRKNKNIKEPNDYNKPACGVSAT